MAAPAPARLYGPLLIAGDFQATCAFYRDMIGLPIEGNPPYAECTGEMSRFSIVDGRFWAQVNGSELAVLPGAAIPPSSVLSIEVPDLDAVFERLMALQVRFLSPPTDRAPMGLRNAFLRDPDGRTVELMTRLAPTT